MEHRDDRISALTNTGLPRIKVPRTRIENLVEVIAAAGMLFWILTLIIYYPQLPDRIPTHFNFAGDPDAWGSKSTIWLLVGIMVLLYALLSWVATFPHRYNYPWSFPVEKAAEQYRIARTMITILKALIVWLFAWILYETIQIGLGKSKTLGPELMFVFLGLIAIVIVGYFVAARRAR